MATFYAFYPPSSAGSSSNLSVGPNGSTIPADSTLVGGENPSGNLQPLQTDASGNLLVSLAAEPGAPFHVIVDSSALPTGASTSALQGTGNTSLASIVSNQTNGTQVTTISGTVPLPTGAATSANQTNASQKTQIVDGSGNVIASTSNALNVQVENFPATQPISGTVAVTQSTTPWVVGQGTAANLNATVVQGTAANLNATVAIAAAQTLATVTTVGAVTAITNALPAGTNLLGKVGIDQTTVGTTNGVSIAQIGSTTVLTGSGTTGAGAQRTVLATHATGTITSVAGNTASTTALAANTARSGAMFYNDSTQIMYLALASTASTSSYTVQMPPNAYYELPTAGCYNGIVTFIQSSANGNIRVTEISG